MMTMLEMMGLVGVTLVVSHGTIFDGLRAWLLRFEHPANFLRWVGLLMSCPQCSGFWVGAVWALALQKPWVTVFVAAGVVSVATIAADFVFRLTSAFVDRVSGNERQEVIQQLLEIRARRQALKEAKTKQATGEGLSEDEAHAILDEQTEMADFGAGG